MSANHIMPPCMILCGGQGTRLREITELLPKPLVPIGPQPILWHIMKSYAAFGVKRFILCLGYKKEAFVDYFLNYHERLTDITITLGKNKNIVYHSSHGEEDWEVTLVDTGDKTMTGGRIFKASKYLHKIDKDFFLTYGDAVANINIKNLYNHHKTKNKEITITAIHPKGRFGVINLKNENVISFSEKPAVETDLINGGFMVIKKSFINKYLQDQSSLTFEQEPLKNAVKNKQMSAFVHEGFWQCMDIQREHELLNKLWDEGNAPWTEAWGNNK